MSQDIIRETNFFLQSILSGIFIIFIYDLLRILRRIVKHGVFAVACEDICYWVMSSILIFQMLYRENDGLIRGFSIAGVVLGMLVYNLSISTFIVKYSSLIFNKIIRFFTRILYYILKPFVWGGRKVSVQGNKINKKVKKISSFFLKRLKKLIKEFRIVLTRH